MSNEKKLPLFDRQEKIEVEGTIERVIFHNQDNGFTVLKILPTTQAEGGVSKKGGNFSADPVNCVGHMVSPKIGTRMKFAGHYVNNPRFGRQLAFEISEEIMPAAEEDIRLYLSSGLIKGVGPELASRIVDKFGTDTIRILDEEPEKLKGIYGIGKKNLIRICDSWNEHRSMRDLLLFLQPHGISPAYAIRIYKAYGQDAKTIVSENPYRLAMDIHGIGFVTADSIASRFGFSSDHPLRVQAAALYILQKASDDGHVFLPVDTLTEKVCKLLDVDATLVARAINSLELDQRIVCEDFNSAIWNARSQTSVYLSRFYHCESKIAYYLKRLLNSPKSVRFNNADSIISGVLRNLPITLASCQADAVSASAASKALVITGGPGTGKTTIINAIIRVFESVGAKILLAAPTGRAAKRMAETSGRDARTIHRLLEYSPKEDSFCRNEDNPLACGILIVDEASMMDTLLFYYLLKALPLGATLVLVGDVHQLPSVGPGNVLGDIIESRAVPVIELNEIFRQSAESEIICNAHLINHGKMPVLEKNRDRLSDFYFISRDDPEETADLVIDLIKNHIPRRFGFDPINEIQLLTPMRKGAVGADRMNSRLQAALNPNSPEVKRGDKAFRLHDKVMQVRNNYDKDIFNGDIGRIVYLNPKERELSVDFDGLVMPYAFDELDELAPAYAISIHKSQGSEYPAVVIPIMMQHYVLLQRNLVYTGVTRSKKLVIMVGESRALRIAIDNNKTAKRYTHLAQRLMQKI